MNWLIEKCALQNIWKNLNQFLLWRVCHGFLLAFDFHKPSLWKFISLIIYIQGKMYGKHPQTGDRLFLYLEYTEEGVHLHEMQSKKKPSTPTNWSNKFSSHFEWELCSNPYRCFYILCVRYEFLTGMPSRWEIEHDYLCLFGLNLLLWLLALLFMGILIVANKNLEFCFRLCIHLFNLNVPINYFAVEWFFWMVLVVVRLLPLLVVASVRTHTV